MPFFVPGPAGAAGANGTASLIVNDEGSGIGTATVLNFAGAGVTATFSNGTATATISGAAGSGGIIGYTALTTAGTTTTSTTFGTVHADAHVAFTGPSSGTVLVRITVQAFNGATTGVMSWGLMNGSGGTVAGPFSVASPEGETAGNVKTISRTFHVSGLSAGTAYDYWFAAKHVTNSYTIRWSNTADEHGPLTMEAFGIP